jgi:hypothetical protein
MQAYFTRRPGSRRQALGYDGGHALAEAVAQDEDRGEHGPHAAQQVVVSSH